ncbi:WAT1-related protein [Hibiscus syriacus]|uniref:WAT1-related protein n=1 Tax=Hibiscus syriacus TaxID=106335 RepID=A0A6A2YBR2_HIBSY|nr:WAT1-related protein At5g40230-like isoform X2 [Hibiscus syriacus]KAE8668604.1 WAT1-related protein [Hibiscus syriacus]
MAGRNEFKELVLPSMAMVGVECSTVVGNILMKAASSKGMSYFVFTAYGYILGTIVFLSLAFLCNRKTALPPLKFPLFSRIFIFQLLGFTGQLCFYKGLQLSSPTLASANSNLIPAFTFILAVIFRMEKVAFKSSSTRAKFIGTIASIFGAFVIILYKGPKVISSLTWTSSSSSLIQRPLVFMSSESNCIIGGLLQVVTFLFVSFEFIIQSQIMKIYPEEITVTFFGKLVGAIISLPVCLLVEPNWSSWRLGSSLAVVSILYSGLIGSSFYSFVHIWGIHLKGPVFVASFKPTAVVIAAVMSAIFLGEAIFLGSVIGALILSAGLYCVLWGKAKEEQEMTDAGTINGRVPLLQRQLS